MKGLVLDERALLMTRTDAVATALEDLDAGTHLRLPDTEYVVVLPEPVSFGHKVAIESIERGDEIRKYGEIIGRASEDIAAGEWVHTHNCESTRGRGDLADPSVAGGSDR